MSALESHLATAIGPANANELLSLIADKGSADLSQLTADIAHAVSQGNLLNNQLGSVVARLEAAEKALAGLPALASRITALEEAVAKMAIPALSQQAPSSTKTG